MTIAAMKKSFQLPPLTERQQQVLGFIRDSIHYRGRPPTLREIGAHMGIRSTNCVNDHLRALERKGYLTRTKDAAEAAIAAMRAAKSWRARERRTLSTRQTRTRTQSARATRRARPATHRRAIAAACSGADGPPPRPSRSPAPTSEGGR